MKMIRNLCLCGLLVVSSGLISGCATQGKVYVPTDTIGRPLPELAYTEEPTKWWQYPLLPFGLLWGLIQDSARAH